MDRLTTPAALTAAIVLLLSGCSAGDDASAEPDEARATPTTESTPTESAAPPPESPLTGAWMVRLRRDRAAERLREAGLAKWQEDFFEAERWPASSESMTMVITFTPIEGTEKAWSGDFQVAYYEAEDWNIGWKGSVGVQGDEMAWTDDFTGTVDRLTYRVKGQRLTMDWQGADVTRFDGYPPEAYAAAYLSEPLTATDCPMEPGVDC